jgi:superkiller protein 3
MFMGGGEMNIQETRRIVVPLVLCLLSAPFACTSYRAERHYKKGLACQKNHDTAQAIKEFTRTLQYEPEHIEARFAIAAAYASQELWNKAISAYRRAVEIDENYFEAHYQLSLLYFIEGDFKNALKHAGIAVKEYPAAQKLIVLIEEETKDSKG